MKIGFGKSLLFVAALVWADANAQQPAADSVDGHMLAAQKAAGLEFPGLLSHTRRTRKSIDRDRCVLRIEKPIKLRPAGLQLLGHCLLVLFWRSFPVRTARLEHA